MPPETNKAQASVETRVKYGLYGAMLLGVVFAVKVGMATQSGEWFLVALSGVGFLWLCVLSICVSGGRM